MSMTWLIEPQAFSASYSAFGDAIERHGHRRIVWNDEWWDLGGLPKFADSALVLFHGSLGNAQRITSQLDWQPGAFCATQEFHCSAWYERAKSWLLHHQWVMTNVEQLVAAPQEIAGHLATDDQVFVRPDSPLKPFSGRVCRLSGLTLEALDFGFYYDDPTIPIVVAPRREINSEWRFVVVDQKVVASSAYDAQTRSSTTNDASPSQLAAQIASQLNVPEPVYVLDLCETTEGLHLLELNPFSGADLYGCDPDAIVTAVARFCEASF